MQVTLDNQPANPLEHPEYLYELYYEEEMSLRDIGEQIGYDHTTVRKRMCEAGIELRDGGGSPPRRTGAPLRISNTGYPAWYSDHRAVLVHRLLAVAEYGYERVVDNHVHHKNRNRIDNRPSNIEILTPAEHRLRHTESDTQRQQLTKNKGQHKENKMASLSDFSDSI